MAVVSVSPPPKKRSGILETALLSSITLGVGAILVWAAAGVVALFFGSVGGEWGWGFGFGWYFTLLAIVVAIIAGIGIAASIAVWKE